MSSPISHSTETNLKEQNSTNSETPTLINVGLGERSYDILIGGGLLDQAGERIASLRPQAKCTIVTDETVASFHLKTLEASLASAGISFKTVALPAGEATKSFDKLSYLLDELLSHEIERGDLVIAFGGGVIGDLAGFAASILRRGVDFVQIPTSLLAQVDSSVGGKTGINSSYGKNLIGAFHQPLLVLCDLDVLKTLDPRQFKAGYAEVVKYGLIKDAEFFNWLSNNRERVFDLDTEALVHAIQTSCAMKAYVVSADEKEHGVRALLNLGHTFGHGFEALCGYGDRLLHGEAIAIGMVLAFEFSEQLGLCQKGLHEEVEAHFKAAGLPTRIQDIPAYEEFSVDMLVDKMRQDKKVERGNLVFILAKAIGDAVVYRDIREEQLREFLNLKLD